MREKRHINRRDVTMMKRVCLLICACSLLSACSTAQMYNFIAGLTDPECGQIASPSDRDRCMKTTNISYEKYEKERQKAKGN